MVLGGLGTVNRWREKVVTVDGSECCGGQPRSAGGVTDLKNRGVRDVFFFVCDGLKGLPASVSTVFPQAIVQACVIHLIRATLRYPSRRYWDQLAGDPRKIYTASTVQAAWAAFEELEEKWGKPYPAIPKMWRAA